MRIRRLESADDLRGVERVNVLAWREAYRGLVPDAVLDRRDPDTSDVPDDALAERLAELTDTDGAFFVAREDDVVGYAFVRWGETKSFVDEYEAGLKELYVHPERWSEGIGTKLLDACLDAIPAEYRRIKLEMLAGNELAQSFYTSRGFERTGSRRAEFGGETLETAIYERDL